MIVFLFNAMAKIKSSVVTRHSLRPQFIEHHKFKSKWQVLQDRYNETPSNIYTHENSMVSDNRTI